MPVKTGTTWIKRNYEKLISEVRKAETVSALEDIKKREDELYHLIVTYGSKAQISVVEIYHRKFLEEYAKREREIETKLDKIIQQYKCADPITVCTRNIRVKAKYSLNYAIYSIAYENRRFVNEVRIMNEGVIGTIVFNVLQYVGYDKYNVNFETLESTVKYDFTPKRFIKVLNVIDPNGKIIPREPYPGMTELDAELFSLYETLKDNINYPSAKSGAILLTYAVIVKALETLKRRGVKINPEISKRQILEMVKKEMDSSLVHRFFIPKLGRKGVTNNY